MFYEDSPLKITALLIFNSKIPKAKNKVKNARKNALRETVVAIANDVIKIHPWKNRTGNNSRSIKYEVGPGGEVAKGELEGAVYSTSGYGGYLETGTAKMPAFPYFKPALDRNIRKLPEGIKAELR